MPDPKTLDRAQLVALAILLAAAIAAREEAEKHSATVEAEMIEDEGTLSLVVTPGAT